MAKNDKIEWDSYPKTPDSFRQTVQMAVKAGLEQEERNRGESGADKAWENRNHSAAAPEARRENAEWPKKAANRAGSRHWYKIWLPAAAIMAAGCIAVAAGSGWLKEHLLSRGFTESEAEALLETEPRQQVSELTDIVYPSGKPKEMEWSGPLLTVREAYFDGSSLYFIAEASEEADSYDLRLRDHASVNGLDGMTSLAKLDGEEGYFGQIEITEQEKAAEILNEDAVEVEMTVVAYPIYEGRIVYTWKDEEEYEELFGTGAFQYEEGGLSYTCYAMSLEDAIAGYTPHELKLEVPLTEEAKRVIEQYREEGVLTESLDAAQGDAEAGSAAEDGADGDVLSETSAEAGSAAAAGAGEDTQAGTSGEAGSAAEEETGASVTGVLAEPVIDGNHITWEIPGDGGSLSIDAQLVQASETVYTGTLRAEGFSEEVLKSLYEEGDPAQWVESDSEEPGLNLRYGDQNIFISGSSESTHYQNDENGEDVQDQAAALDDAAALTLCEQVLDKLGLEGSVEADARFTDFTDECYRAELLLEGLPLARNSQWNTDCSMMVESGALTDVSAPGKLTAKEKEAVTLPGIEKALERVEKYVQDGGLDFAGWEVQPVTEIELEYYVDLTRQGLIFRPIWNFKLTCVAESEDGSTWNVYGHIYIDALTGALIRDTMGW